MSGRGRFYPTCVLLVVVLCGGLGLAQPEPRAYLQGRIYEERSGSGIASATVTLKDEAIGSTKETTTDGSGNYRFSDLTPGTYSMRVSKLGYESAARSGVRVETLQLNGVYFQLTPVATDAAGGEVRKEIAIQWQVPPGKGRIAITGGRLVELNMPQGGGMKPAQDRFVCPQMKPCRIRLTVEGNPARTGSRSTVVEVETETKPFSFFMRDVGRRHPIYIPAYGAIVTDGDDGRSYDEIVAEVQNRGWLTNLQHIQSSPEMTFEKAAKQVRAASIQTWLGLSRDFRIFAVGERLDWVEPRFHAYNVGLPEQRIRFDFLMGRGWGAADRISRSLEDGFLPILRGTLVDDDISYHLTAFVTLEKNPLSVQTLKGTHFLLGEGYGYTDLVTHPAPFGMRPWLPKFKELFPSLLAEEMNRTEETVLMMRIVAVNSASVPRYAWFRNATPQGVPGWRFDAATGWGMDEAGRVVTLSSLDGAPLPAEEMALLLKPGEPATVEVRLPHRPISLERARELAQQGFSERHQECRRFWQEKLASGGSIQLPERRITEMVKAGLLHLDLILYGREPNEPLAPSVGVYTPIGSESSPIIQFLDSMGWHDVARRSLMFFLEKQHEDGFMQNYGDYQIETAGALYTLGEHYRYTRDDAWVKEIEAKVLKSCDFILQWRRGNLQESLRGRGYGMIEGKVGDPQDRLRQFMFNGYHYVALKRVAEMLTKVNPGESRRLASEAEEFRTDIRAALLEAVGKSPVVPLGDGSWSPTAPPWAGYRGPLALYADGGRWYTHGAINTRSAGGGLTHFVPPL